MVLVIKSPLILSELSLQRHIFCRRTNFLKNNLTDREQKKRKDSPPDGYHLTEREKRININQFWIILNNDTTSLSRFLKNVWKNDIKNPFSTKRYYSTEFFWFFCWTLHACHTVINSPIILKSSLLDRASSQLSGEKNRTNLSSLKAFLQL